MSPTQLHKKLNEIQYRRVCLNEEITDPEAKLLDPIHAIQFALQAEESMAFLRAWNEGDWNGCAKNWPEWVEFKY